MEHPTHKHASTHPSPGINLAGWEGRSVSSYILGRETEAGLVLQAAAVRWGAEGTPLSLHGRIFPAWGIEQEVGIFAQLEIEVGASGHRQDKYSEGWTR